jgi:methyl-accepting chemotaxis protein
MAEAPSEATPDTAEGHSPAWTDRLRTFVGYVPSGDTIPDEVWANRHRSILTATLLHVPFLVALGLFQGTEPLSGATIPATPLWVIALGQGVVVGAVALASVSGLSRRLRTALATTGLVATSITLVQYSGGFIEAHFHFFVVLGVLALYEDWLPFGLGILYVALSHGVFGMIDAARVYNHPAAIENPWVWGGIHAVLVAMLALALVQNWVSTEKSRETARQRLRRAEEKQAEVEDLERKRAEIQRKREEVNQAKQDLEDLAEEYSTVMAAAADGDLSVRMEADVDSDAMARIARSFNGMMDETEAAIREIQRFADEVSTASEEADAGVEEVETASEEISESVQEIAAGADEQRQMLEETSEEMTDLSATVEEVAASAETVAERSHETAEVAEAGEATAQEAIEDARAVQAAIDATVDNVEALEERMAEIDEIVGLIGEIAEQTNMLALNANIEAARAGDRGGDGEGFAVVADEVKSLAEETRDSAAEIEELIDETTAQTEATVEEARSAERSMQQGVEAVEEVVEAFERVADNTEATDSGIQEISDATDDQASSTEEAVSMVEEVARIGRSTAQETESASAAAQQQAASVSQVSTNVTALSERAAELRSMLADFEVSATGAGARPDRPAGPAGTPLANDGGQPD